MRNQKITLDHGTGGRQSAELISSITNTLGDVYTGEMQDSAIVAVGSKFIAITTDSFVVSPTFFGNGNVGKIAVAGTVNDVAVSGAKPLYLTLAIILEEGFPIDSLIRIMESVRDTARAAGVSIVAGDTKVVRAGEADGIYLNTTGVGIFDHCRAPLDSRNLLPGDRLIVTGFLGDHSIHLLSLREGLGFEKRILSDCAPLNHPIAALMDVCGEEIRCMRDVTRGGLGTVLNELAAASGFSIHIAEPSLPIRRETQMAADMLGVDVLYLANEGVLCVAVSETALPAALESLRSYPETSHSIAIGEVTEDTQAIVLMSDGQEKLRQVELLSGAQLPRLC